ncbi:MAG TPA: spore coat protein CotJB [Ruminococcaceae bacterium]|jgi:spore coat protein JB|nr:spore coat protein CotJB [Oscillospiraceae bacterium]HCA30947.1 spore coat protein CotJB [Oscillospiraceae bacterium]
MTNRYNDDLEKLMALQFAIVELNLFLDTHPDSEQALQDYHKLLEQFEAAKKMYIEKYGPLVNFGYGKSRFPWQWVNEPWPWDM